MACSTAYVAKYDDGTMVPASSLDRLLRKKGADVQVTYYDYLAGKPLTPETTAAFRAKVVSAVERKEYETTDHVFTSVTVSGVLFLYVSLDNSVRANRAGHPVYERLGAICAVINRVIEDHSDVVVFFSESCRASFKEVHGVRRDVTSWLDIRCTIAETLGLLFLAEKRNNEDQSGMSFGISAFYRGRKIDTYFAQQVLDEGYGSATLGVKLTTGEVCWGVHFPLDFRRSGSENAAHKTMLGLQKVFNAYDGSVCALGDFNTIPGTIEDAIMEAVSPVFELIGGDTLTFYGSYFDTIPVDESWPSLV